MAGGYSKLEGGGEIGEEGSEEYVQVDVSSDLPSAAPAVADDASLSAYVPRYSSPVVLSGYAAEQPGQSEPLLYETPHLPLYYSGAAAAASAATSGIAGVAGSGNGGGGGEGAGASMRDAEEGRSSGCCGRSPSEAAMIAVVREMQYTAKPLNWLRSSWEAYKLQWWQLLRGYLMWDIIIASTQGLFFGLSFLLFGNLFADGNDMHDSVVPGSHPSARHRRPAAGMIVLFVFFYIAYAFVNILLISGVVTSVMNVSRRFIRGETSTWRHCFSVVDSPTYWRVFRVIVPVTFSIHIASMFFVIPALLIAPLFLFAIPLIVEKRFLSGRTAIQVSAIAVRKQYLPILSFTLALSIATIVLAWITFGLSVLVILPVAIATVVFAYHDVFGVDGAVDRPADVIRAKFEADKAAGEEAAREARARAQASFEAQQQILLQQRQAQIQVQLQQQQQLQLQQQQMNLHLQHQQQVHMQQQHQQMHPMQAPVHAPAQYTYAPHLQHHQQQQQQQQPHLQHQQLLQQQPALPLPAHAPVQQQQQQHLQVRHNSVSTASTTAPTTAFASQAQLQQLQQLQAQLRSQNSNA